LFSPGWDNESSKVLAFTIGGRNDNSYDIHVMMNFDHLPLSFEIPPAVKNKKWELYTDTSVDDTGVTKKDIIDTNEYFANPYSIVILILT
jgi:hypothetical protein